MQLTSYTDYSLRVLIYLASHPDRKATISEMADAYQISRNHLVKVVHRLAQHGWIITTRGKSGGMQLARSPEQINIGEVVRQTEPHMNLLECFDKANDRCAISPVCTLKSVLYQARRAFLDTIDQYTLADVLGQHADAIAEILDTNAAQAAANAKKE